ncbi:alcohol dehydrogenase [Mycobacterium florentinum]|uniref:Alcohol dehydrogenase n=1 Tax=Mycobacterium florentinum TaxID=292462 RepID=A0A1X1U2Z5_MYCFL|nr:alcohol dehydrogenase catalytic domain-containing protein [Mycobacterium florentinum]MCV7411028.1 alcohol dehydrogenase catalytic domain-containing protein [Mycobacterium florentinum]ORV51212.1 alcohol dehydrogenase [Mycobacterium florentinum]BBX80369.1 Zn-dependent alcohol dehydrogenase [Mycobacterium florentinum]
MRAAVTTEDHGFDIIEIPCPTPGPGELVIRVAACGICGSDIKAQPFMPAGIIMGHELGGEIVAVGSDAGGWQQGTNVAVLPVVSCGDCRYCAAGAVSHCPATRYIGMGPDGGGFAEFAAVPAKHAFVLPGEINCSYSALVEPFAVGLHGVHNANVTPGEDVLVVGAGGVGLTTIAWARALGARRVTAVDPDAQRRETARAMDATDVVASVADADTNGYDAAVECVGRPELLRACQAAVRPQGRIVISGACAEPMPVEPITALLKELTIRYSVAYTPDEFRTVISAFASGAVDPAPMVGPTLGLDRITEAFDLVRGSRTHGRVLVKPE